MVYLAIQMAIFLIVAAAAGVITGWWANQLRTNWNAKDEIDEKDVFAIKHRLDQCFDENAMLRRKLKKSESVVKRSGRNGEVEDIGSNDALGEKVKVLMEDLQIRDDTIVALEKELEAVRSSSS